MIIQKWIKWILEKMRISNIFKEVKIPFSGDMMPLPEDLNGASKYACEMDFKIAASRHGLEFCISRPHNVYG